MLKTLIRTLLRNDALPQLDEGSWSPSGWSHGVTSDERCRSSAVAMLPWLRAPAPSASAATPAAPERNAA